MTDKKKSESAESQNTPPVQKPKERPLPPVYLHQERGFGSTSQLLNQKMVISRLVKNK